jgi:hypothetical protein
MPVRDESGASNRARAPRELGTGAGRRAAAARPLTRPARARRARLACAAGLGPLNGGVRQDPRQRAAQQTAQLKA